ncbi:hypothetical protein [Egicoccus sp. AB-alg2]|uniref:hypothetical protein n=1 Tax=Egicoccus sp. AB-alg2 TaxID=3242693 RepID=UPI00359DE93B
MFVQVIHAADADPDVLDVMTRWQQELRPGAIGFLGSTGGRTPSGDLIVVARFASEEEARRNSERPEQGDWWSQVSKHLHGEVRFHDCTDVATMLEGGSDEAGFVQVITARADEGVTAKEVAERASRFVSAHRPDVLGGLCAVAPDGTMFEVVYFTSEQEAREHEAAELPEDAAAEMEEFWSRFGEPRYFDLPQPVIWS